MFTPDLMFTSIEFHWEVSNYCKGVPILDFCRYADTPILVIADMPIFSHIKNMQIYNLKCRYWNIGNIGTGIVSR